MRQAGDCTIRTFVVILFDQLVQIDRQHFKDNAQVVPENKVVLDSGDVVFVVRIVRRVEQLQNSNFHKRLLVIRRLVFDDFDGIQLVGPQMQTLCDLAKRPAAEKINHTVLVRRQPDHVVHVQDIVVIRIIKRVIGCGL